MLKKTFQDKTEKILCKIIAKLSAIHFHNYSTLQVFSIFLNIVFNIFEKCFMKSNIKTYSRVICLKMHLYLENSSFPNCRVKIQFNF